MSGAVKFIAIIIVLAIIVYISVKYIYGKATIQDVAPDKFVLSDAKSIYLSDNVTQNILKPSGSTIMAFVNVNFGDRTASTTSEYQSLIGIEGAFSLDISPKGSQLTVVTANGLVNDNTEQVQIPPLPLQKWVCVSILRDGRRFDIMYDDQLVASHRFEYFPKVVLQPLVVGNTTLLGSGIHVLIAPYRLTPSDVSKQRAKLSDTTGKPVGADTEFGLPPIPFTSIRSICIPGIPCNPVSNPPSNALKAWSTPFS
jgi:hypothetical protein